MNSQQSTERALVVGVGLKKDPVGEIKESLAELEELVYAAGAEIIAVATQLVTQWNPSTLIGRGKVSEIKKMIDDCEPNLVVVDHQLSGVQIRNLEDQWKLRVIDRNQLILDIFAKRAQSYEGKLQVELAQLMDQMPRMVGAWLSSLSRQGGGIGTKGPGEKALEIDRRRMQERIIQIKSQLETVKKQRKEHRRSRERKHVPSLALIGYTNSGKSTLLNKLTNSKVMTKDMVFATLDPVTRKVYLTDSQQAVITDTVGFIRRLPKELIEAFQATLEESASADILLHVIDFSSEQWDQQIQTIDELIVKFNWQEKPRIYIFNKSDLISKEKQFQVDRHPRVFVSGTQGTGIDNLKNLMVKTLKDLRTEYQFFFPKSDEYLIYDLARVAEITKKESASKGTLCYASLASQNLGPWKSFIVESEKKTKSLI